MVALMQAIQSEDAQSEDYCCATDNAISAVFSILLSGMVSGHLFNQGLQLFVSCLPMQFDGEEAQTVHEKVVSTLKTGTLFNGCKNEVMKILPYLLLPITDDGDNEIEISYEETKYEVAQLLNSLNAGERNNIMRTVDPELKPIINNILSNIH